MMWPDHCVQNADGANFAPGLKYDLQKDIFVKKGNKNFIDSYSAFYDNGGFQPTYLTATETLEARLKTLGVTHIYVVGLATDYCVQFSAKDAKKLGFEVTLVTDASEGKDEVHIREKILPELAENKINLRTVAEVISELKGGPMPSQKDDSPDTIQMGVPVQQVASTKQGASTSPLADKPPVPPFKRANAKLNVLEETNTQGSNKVAKVGELGVSGHKQNKVDTSGEKGDKSNSDETKASWPSVEKNPAKSETKEKDAASSTNPNPPTKANEQKGVGSSQSGILLINPWIAPLVIFALALMFASKRQRATKRDIEFKLLSLEDEL